MLRKTLNLCESVVAKRVNNAGILTLNRPKALNALNHEMVISMHAQLRTWMKEKDVKLVIQNAEGGKAFCAGGDIRSITDAGRNGDMVQILLNLAYAPREVVSDFVFGPGIAKTFKNHA